MKKIIALLFITLFLIAGCGQNKPADPIAEELSKTHVGPTVQPFSNGPSEMPRN
ncbi:hypothetical protein J7J83_02170 [bacterium]|nr:hypothetical protein [bacterium]